MFRYRCPLKPPVFPIRAVTIDTLMEGLSSLTYILLNPIILQVTLQMSVNPTGERSRNSLNFSYTIFFFFFFFFFSEMFIKQSSKLHMTICKEKTFDLIVIWS